MQRDGRIWVALNCSVDKVPPNAWSYVDVVWYHTSNARVKKKDDGFAEEMEWAKEPDWHRPDRDWTEWIPMVNGAEFEELPWYHVVDDPSVIKRTEFNRCILEKEQRDQVVADLKQVWSVIANVRQYSTFPPNIPAPIEFSYNDRYLARDLSKEVKVYFTNAKRKMLEYLGWVNWWKCIDDRWDQLASEGVRDTIMSYKLHEYGKRGVILNLARDHPTINVPVLLHHNVPVIYPWTIREDQHVHYAKMAPILLDAYKKKKKLVGGDFFAFDDARKSSELFRSLFDYNHYFEALPPESMEAPELAPAELKESWEYFMIDGEGFGRRSVPEVDWQHYYALRFYYRIFGDVQSDDVTIIFYRSLKEICLPPKFKFMAGGSDYDPEDADDAAWSSSDEDHVPTDRVRDALDDDVLIREYSRLRFAPHPGQRYDAATGVEVEAAWTGPQSLSCWTAAMNERLPPSPGSPAFVHVRNSVKRIAQLIMESDLEAMDVDHDPGSSGNVAIDIDDLFDFNTQSLLAATSRAALATPSRSLLHRMSDTPVQGTSGESNDTRAPPSLLDRMGNSKKEQEARAAAWMTCSIPSTLALGAPVFNLAGRGVRWNSLFLNKVFLLLPEAFARVRAQHIALTDTRVHSAEDLLDRLVEHGISFKLAIRDEDIKLFRPAEVHLTDRKWGASVYSANVQEDPLLIGMGGREFVERWGRQSKEIFSRDHARGLVSMGGVYSWLALSNGRDTLVPAFKNGPSKQVTLHQRGWTDIADNDSLFLVGDEMLADELNILLGKLHGEEKYIWPKPEFLWDFSAHFSGALHPNWLSALKIIEGELSRFEPRHRTRGEFRELLRKGSRTNQLPSATRVSHEDFQDEENVLNELFADDWTKVCVRRLALPGIFQNIAAGA
ncbi:hypothetical protein DFH06DRAFT_1343907 [Mycena polygramma]|nr:hypothetical protein DFH06DRAFT_1343907 [Mycena polygramma]